MQSTDPLGENATLDDIREAIIGMSEADTLKIEMAARSFSKGSEYEPRELFQEAISRTLAGVGSKDGRHCPKSTPFVAFFIMTMMSVANGSRSSENRRNTINLEAITPPGASVEDVLGSMSCHSPYPDPLTLVADGEEAALITQKAQEVITVLEEYFAEDENVLFIIFGLQDEKTAKEIQYISGMNQKDYEAARRRFRRGIADLFPEKRLV